MAAERPVLIVGSGPTGLTAAMELQRMGVPVRLIDKAAGPSTTSRALAVQARTVELMAQRGLADRMLALGNRGRAAALYADGKPLARVDLSRIPSRYNFILLLSQAETERLLREHLQAAGVPVEFGTELIAFAMSEDPLHPENDTVTATFQTADGNIDLLDAAYLICAEGAHSNVRQTLGLPFAGKSLENIYALGDLYVDGAIPDDELSIFLGLEGLLAVFPMGDHRFRMIATEGGDAEANAPAPSLEALQQMWDRAASIPAHLRDLQWSSRFRINSRIVERLRVGRVFLGGDSAHIHSPAGGQGMNTGIQDMINLCWKLAMVYRGTPDPKLLDTYEAERLPVIQSVVRTTETATEAMQSQKGWVHSMITHLAPIALGMGFVQNNAAHILSQTAYTYAKGPLAEHAAGAAHLHAGDRVPDVAMEDGSWLHGRLDPSRFTLLALTPAAMDEARKVGAEFGDNVSVVAAGAAQSVFGQAAFALVRPDGHLACAGTRLDGAVEWLQRWCTQKDRSA